MNQIDPNVVKELVESHGAALTLFARQWCRAPDDALQESLLDLLRQDRLPDNPVAWMYTTVRRRAMNVARAESRREYHQQQVGRQQDSWFVPTNCDSFDSLNYESLLARLPLLDREIVVTRIWGNLTFAQIGELVQQTLSTVHRRYQQALSKLEKMIEEQETPRRQVTKRQNDENRTPLP